MQALAAEFSGYRRKIPLLFAEKSLKIVSTHSFDVLAKSTDLLALRETHLTFPELAFTVSTRAMLGAGIALLLADRLTTEQRKAIGATLTAVGLLTTIPIVWTILGKCERA